MSDRQPKTARAWILAREALELLGGSVGASSWDETDETGDSLASSLRELLDRAKSALRAGARNARRAVEKIGAAAIEGASWATGAARDALPAIAREAAAVSTSALGALVPWWVVPLALLYLARGSFDGSRRS